MLRSPRSSMLPLAILRRILRMIFPERVLGSTGHQWMVSGLAKEPISRVTSSSNDASSSGVALMSSMGVTKA